MEQEFVTIQRTNNADDTWTGPREAAETFMANGHWKLAPKTKQPTDPSNPDTASLADDK